MADDEARIDGPSSIRPSSGRSKRCTSVWAIRIVRDFARALSHGHLVEEPAVDAGNRHHAALAAGAANGGLARDARPPNGCYPPMSHFFWTPCHFPPARSQSALLVKRWVDGEVVLELVSGVVGELLGGAGGMPGVFGMLPPGGEPGRLDGAGLGFVGPGVVLVCADASTGASPMAATRPAKTSFFIASFFMMRPSYAAESAAASTQGFETAAPVPVQVWPQRSKAIANSQVMENAAAVGRRISGRGEERPR